MKRYVCTVASGLLLALASTGTAAASILPLPGQTGTQKATLGDQSVGEQRNDASVTQKQGNGNVNVSPAIAVFGDAETTNEQGNGNEADASVVQSNDATQSQSSTQKQHATQDGSGCCDGRSQTAEQTASLGDQSVGEQQNDADVTQKQGNGNVNVSPAIAVFGNAETTNEQGNDNSATADVDQSNSVDQSQSSFQKQSVRQTGDGCCSSGQSQTGRQYVDGGDQSVEKQKNTADVTQWQGNGNVNVSPAIAVFGNAETTNEQGNGNDADASVRQSNEATQSQSSSQKQYATLDGSGCCTRSHECTLHHPCERSSACKAHARCASGPHWKKEHCCDGRSQTAEQTASLGDQSVGEQRNDADVTQKQGNGNVNVSPAIALGGFRYACTSKCGKSWHPVGGDAETTNEQGNWNEARANVDQSNSVDQSQVSYQRQSIVDTCKGLVKH